MLKTALLMGCALIASAAWAEVDVNLANVAELDSIKGIGPNLSRHILQQRDQAKFKDWSDFMARVPGIKPKAAAKLSAEGLTVDGAPFAGPLAKP